MSHFIGATGLNDFHFLESNINANRMEIMNINDVVLNNFNEYTNEIININDLINNNYNEYTNEITNINNLITNNYDIFTNEMENIYNNFEYFNSLIYTTPQRDNPDKTSLIIKAVDSTHVDGFRFQYGDAWEDCKTRINTENGDVEVYFEGSLENFPFIWGRWVSVRDSIDKIGKAFNIDFNPEIPNPWEGLSTFTEGAVAIAVVGLVAQKVIADGLLKDNIISLVEVLNNTSNTHTSNWIYNNSNELAIQDLFTSNWVYNNSNELAIQDLFTSNWVYNNSNELAIQDLFTSNWVYNNSNELAIQDLYTSNWVYNNSNELAIQDLYTSNWVYNNSNELAIEDKQTNDLIKSFENYFETDNLKVNTLATIGNYANNMPFIYYPFDTILFDWGRNSTFDYVENFKVFDKIKGKDKTRDYYIYWGYNNKINFHFLPEITPTIPLSQGITISFWYAVTAYIYDLTWGDRRNDSFVFETRKLFNDDLGIQIKFVFPQNSFDYDFKIEFTVTYNNSLYNATYPIDNIPMDKEEWHHLCLKIGETKQVNGNDRKTIKVYRDKIQLYEYLLPPTAITSIINLDDMYLGANKYADGVCRFDMSDFAIFLDGDTDVQKCYNLTTTTIFNGNDTLKVRQNAEFESISCLKITIGNKVISSVSHSENFLKDVPEIGTVSVIENDENPLDYTEVPVEEQPQTFGAYTEETFNASLEPLAAADEPIQTFGFELPSFFNRTSFYVGEKAINDARNLINFTGSDGFIKFSNGNKSTIPQIAKITVNDIEEDAFKYLYTEERFNTSFENKNTDDLDEGDDNLYYSSSLFDNDINTRYGIYLNEGYIGIGTTEPLQKLDVNGVVKATTFSGSGASLTTVNLADRTTDNLPEGQNRLYFTYQRVGDIATASNIINNVVPFSNIYDFQYSLTTYIYPNDGETCYDYDIKTNGINYHLVSSLANGFRITERTGLEYVGEVNGYFDGTTQCWYNNSKGKHLTALVETRRTGEWFYYYFDEPVSVYASGIMRSANHLAPHRYDLYGSDDNTNWVRIYDMTTNMIYTNNYHLITLTEPTQEYKYWGICITKALFNSSSGYSLKFERWDLYYNVKVHNTLINFVTGNNQIQYQINNLETDNVREGTNLYYTTARANTDFDARLATKTTDDLSDATATNKYYTTARANTDFDARLATKTTDDLSDATATNKYYTTARANTDFDARLATKTTDDLSDATATNKYYSSTLFNNDFGSKTTDDLTDSGANNKYYKSSLFDDDINTRYGIYVNAGNIGIGSTLPTKKFQVVGSIEATEYVYGDGRHLTNLPITSSQWTTSGANIYYTTGNVGIGTNNPTTNLEVLNYGIIGSAGIGTYNNLSTWAEFRHKDLLASTQSYALIQNNVGRTILNSATSQPIEFRENNVTKMILTGGNIGINSTSPTQRLDVNGTVKATTFTGTDAIFSGNVGIGTASAGSYKLNCQGGNILFDVGRGDVYLEYNATYDKNNGSGLTLRTSTNPSSTGTDTNGHIFAVRNSTGSSELWVGSLLTSTGYNDYFGVGFKASTAYTEGDITDYEIMMNCINNRIDLGGNNAIDWNTANILKIGMNHTTTRIINNLDVSGQYHHNNRKIMDVISDELTFYGYGTYNEDVLFRFSDGGNNNNIMYLSKSRNVYCANDLIVNHDLSVSGLIDANNLNIATTIDANYVKSTSASHTNIYLPYNDTSRWRIYHVASLSLWNSSWGGLQVNDLMFQYGPLDDAGEQWLRSYDNNNDDLDTTLTHRCIPEDYDLISTISSNLEFYQGMIVSTTGFYQDINSSNQLFSSNIRMDSSLPVIKISDVSKCPAVYGVITNVEDIDDKRVYHTGKWYYSYKKTDGHRIIINAIGEGAILVSNYKTTETTLTKINNGDYICSSPLYGYGMVQDDDILHNYTVAKATCPVDFVDSTSPFYYTNFKYRTEQYNGNEYIIVLIGCTYHCA